jgi:hypothetical protein
MIRRPEYLSPSALKTWETDRREYYIRYLGPKIANVPQTPPMAIGSAFDAYIKGELLNRFSGSCSGCKSTEELLSTSVDSNLLPIARVDGKIVFEDYIRSGALDRLLRLADKIRGHTLMLDGDKIITVNVETKASTPLRLRGKIDYRIIGDLGSAILDWKVNGYYSKASPKPGYVWSSKTGLPHKDTLPTLTEHGISHVSCPIDAEHQTQLDTYRIVEEDLNALVLIHQLTYGSKAGCVVTEYCTSASKRDTLIERYLGCWEAIHSGRVFTDLSPEDDAREQANLDCLAGDSAFAALTR